MHIVADAREGEVQRSGDGVSGTLSYFRKTEFGHLPMIAAGPYAGRERVTYLF